MPMQALGDFLSGNQNHLRGKTLVACCKGIDLATGLGPTALISKRVSGARPAVLTGPSFAADIARGLPTALTLACADPAVVKLLQHDLNTPALRLYRSSDPAGAELGGALKNVIALAAGMVIGCGFGDSARAALMTRGFVEMQRFAAHKGADGATLYGLSGFGDLVLTCTSDLSRNFAHGFAVGRGGALDTEKTVEGIATSHAVAGIAREANLDMPITLMVSAVLDGSLTINEATETLMSRALREE
jgi:glycerol-3-phosphate dehydrogenase (NAD(P)+)